MIDPFSVEGMLNEKPLIHFPVELLVKIENPDGTPTGEEKIVIVCGCDVRYSYELGHEDEPEDSSFLDLLKHVDKPNEELLPNWDEITGDPKSEIW